MQETSTTQEELGKAVGVTRQTIAQYANGQNTPDVETFAKIADHFGVSYDYILGYSDARHREHHSVNEETGLSEQAILVLKNWCEMYEDENSNGTTGTKVTKAPPELNQIIESQHFRDMIACIRGLRLLAGQNSPASYVLSPMGIGPARLSVLEDFWGTSGAREDLMSRAVRAFGSIIDEIAPPPDPGGPRQATQADIDAFFGRTPEARGSENGK